MPQLGDSLRRLQAGDRQPLGESRSWITGTSLWRVDGFRPFKPPFKSGFRTVFHRFLPFFSHPEEFLLGV